MKKSVLNKILLAGVTLMAPMMVNAKSANISIVGNDNVYQDEYITLSVEVNNIVDENNISAVGGDVVYDNDYLTLISTKGVTAPYKFDGNKIKENTYRIAGLDFTLANGIKDTTKVYELTFKANKVGNTTIEFKNPEIVASDVRLVDSTTSSKTINVLQKEIALEKNEVVTPVITPVVIPVVNNQVNTTRSTKKLDIKDFIKDNNLLNNKINPFNINKILKNIDFNKVSKYFNSLNR